MSSYSKLDIAVVAAKAHCFLTAREKYTVAFRWHIFSLQSSQQVQCISLSWWFLQNRVNANLSCLHGVSILNIGYKNKIWVLNKWIWSPVFVILPDSLMKGNSWHVFFVNLFLYLALVVGMYRMFVSWFCHAPENQILPGLTLIFYEHLFQF